MRKVDFIQWFTKDDVFIAEAPLPEASDETIREALMRFATDEIPDYFKIVDHEGNAIRFTPRVKVIMSGGQYFEETQQLLKHISLEIHGKSTVKNPDGSHMLKRVGINDVITGEPEYILPRRYQFNNDENLNERILQKLIEELKLIDFRYNSSIQLKVTIE